MRGVATVDISETTADGAIRAAIRAELAPMIDELRGFVDRRIHELSAEVHATVQMVDYSESNLSGQLARIHDQVATMVAMPVDVTRNSGMELEAVVQATETAANTIMEAAEAIADWLHDGSRDAESLEQVAARINTIFEACTFQDVTGQRIRRAIKNLQQVETMLDEMMPGEREAATPITMDSVAGNPDLLQNEVDRLFG
jgi:chemotaxis protein CheZ